MKRLKLEFKFSFMFIVTFSLLFDKSHITFYSLVAALFHEAGHIIAVLVLEKCPIKITFSLRGIAAENEGVLHHEIICLSAGPAVNFFIAILYPIFPIFSIVNLIVGGINLLPTSQSDGARLLNIFLRREVEPSFVISAERIIGVLFLVPLTALLIYTAISNPYNYTLLILIVYLVVFLAEGRGLD